MRGVAVSIALLALLASGCVGPDDEARRTNQSPRAGLRAPVIAPLGDGADCASANDCTPPRACDFDLGACRVVFEAACEGEPPCVPSMDPDGDPLTFIFQFNDGSQALHTASSVAFHTFTQEGVYTVLVEATDIHGASSVAAQDVSIRADYPEVPDFCAEISKPCVVGDQCDKGVCFANGGTLE